MVTDVLYGAAVEPTGSGQLTGARQPLAGPLTYVTGFEQNEVYLC